MTDETNKEKQIFSEIIASPADKRAALLKEACGKDAELLRRVQALLNAYSDESPVLRTLQVTLPDSQRISEGPGTKIGRYKLLQQIGEGGMGVVYMAEQEEPVRRRVALKIIKLGMDSKQVVARFEAERQALALMDHPNIARVLDGGATETGRPYFVMELVQGVPITEFCDKNKLPAKERLKLFVQVCQAIQSAHQKGIIHRDIKPSNVLVTLHHGAAMPKVIDFGIAKATNQKLTEKTLFTNYATMIGTPAYMSPEQAEMSSMDVDTRTDVYALGVLLYELLTGTTPFPDKRLRSLGYGEMQRVIVEEEPERPSTRLSTMANEQKAAVAKERGEELGTLSRLLKGDLDWIVMKCLEKDRTRRYETANGLAMDIQRHLGNEPVVARPPSTVYKLQKAFRRNRLVFAAAGTIALVIIVGALVSSWQAFRATQAKRAAIAERNKAEKARVEMDRQRSRAGRESEAKGRALTAARETLYAADMLLAQQGLTGGNLGQTRKLLRKHQPKSGEEDIRGWEWRYLWGRSASDELFTIGHHSNFVRSVAFSPKGNVLASSSRDRTVKLWDLSTRKQIAELVHPRAVQSVVFSSTGNLLATAVRGSNVLLWDALSREEIWRVPITNGLSDEQHSMPIVFSPRVNEVLAVGAKNGVISLWDTTTRSQLAAKKVTGNHVLALTYSGDGQRLAVGSELGEIHICDANSLRPLISLAHGNSFITSLSFSPDNRVLASAAFIDSTIVLWDTESGSEIARLTNHTAWVGGVAFLQDGRRLISVSADHSIRFWDVVTFREIARLQGYENEVQRLAVSSNGELLATGGKDNSVKLWKTVPKPTQLTSLVLNAGWLDHVVSADQRMLLSKLVDGTMQLRDTKDLSLLRSFALPITNYSTWALSPGGRAIVFGQPDGRIRLWNIPEQKFLADFKAHANQVVKSVYSADGRILATLGDDKKARIWEMSSRELLHEYDTPGRWFEKFTISAKAQKLALAYDEYDAQGFIRLWNLESRREVAAFPAHLETIRDIAFSPDEKTFATGTTDGLAKLWDVDDVTRPRFVLGGATKVVNSLAFSPDGRRLAASGASGETRIWDIHSGLELLSLKGGNEYVPYSFFVDEDTLVTAGSMIGMHKTEFFLWRAPSMAEIDAAEAKQKP